MYAMFVRTGTLKLWQATYCHSSNHEACARYKIAVTGKPVPSTLLPNGKDLAKQS